MRVDVITEIVDALLVGEVRGVYAQRDEFLVELDMDFRIFRGLNRPHHHHHHHYAKHNIQLWNPNLSPDLPHQHFKPVF